MEKEKVDISMDGFCMSGDNKLLAAILDRLPKRLALKLKGKIVECFEQIAHLNEEEDLF